MISKAELAKHSTPEDCWVAIHGIVLEVDATLQAEHPGGPEVILGIAGKDVTEDYEDIGHSDSAREWSDKFVVGALKEAVTGSGAAGAESKDTDAASPTSETTENSAEKNPDFRPLLAAQYREKGEALFLEELRVPRTSELGAAGGKGSGIGVFPLVVAVIFAIAAYVFFQD